MLLFGCHSRFWRRIAVRSLAAAASALEGLGGGSCPAMFSVRMLTGVILNVSLAFLQMRAFLLSAAELQENPY